MTDAPNLNRLFPVPWGVQWAAWSEAEMLLLFGNLRGKPIEEEFLTGVVARKPEVLTWEEVEQVKVAVRMQEVWGS